MQLLDSEVRIKQFQNNDQKFLKAAVTFTLWDELSPVWMHLVESK